MSTHTANTEAVINSHVGAVTVAIRGSPDVAIEVSAVPLPELPDGMIVDGVMLFLIRLASPVSQDLPVTFSASANQEGGPESGQWLDSMAFENARGIFQVAIRDDEWLAAQGIVAEPVSYGRHGFFQTIREAPSGTVLYASVAWRTVFTGTEKNSSTWFAADLALPA
jgi:hypothetical protein